jgi:hypothetical protein
MNDQTNTDDAEVPGAPPAELPADQPAKAAGVVATTVIDSPLDASTHFVLSLCVEWRG